MAHSFYSTFWVSVMAGLALVLLVYLFPQMLAKWGRMGALIGSVFVIVTLCRAYVRGYWIARWLSGSGGRDRKPR